MSESLPAGWRSTRLGDIATEVRNGVSTKPSGDVGTPILRISAVRPMAMNPRDVRYLEGAPESWRAYALRENDLLFTRYNGNPELVGACARVPSEVPPGVVYPDKLIRVRLDPTQAVPAFVERAVHVGASRDFIDQKTKTSAGQVGISGADLKNVPLDLPPLAEQDRIVAKLDTLQASSRRAREALDSIAPLLEKLRQSILAAAFRGDLTRDWRAKHPDVEPASELLKRIRVERRKKWEEAELAKMVAKGKPPTDDRWKGKYEEPKPVDPTGLPELPEGWCWTPFDEVADVDLGRQRAPQYLTGKFNRPYLRVANVKDDWLDLNDVNVMDFDEDDYVHYRLEPGDILLSEGQSPELVGQSAIYRGGIEGLCFQKTLHRFRRYPSGPSPEYAQLVFRHYVRAGTFRAVASLTTNIAHLTLVRLKALHFPLAPLAEQQELVRRAQAAMTRLHELEEATELAEVRLGRAERAILARAFRGELVPQDPNDESVTVSAHPDALPPGPARPSSRRRAADHASGSPKRTRRRAS